MHDNTFVPTGSILGLPGDALSLPGPGYASPPPPRSSPRERAEGGGSPPLGIHASIASGVSPALALGDGVKRRFALQSNARAVLPSWRVSMCHRVPQVASVELYHHAEFASASYGGLQTCGSVHVCPVCGAKIAARRSAEVLDAAQRWIARGGSVLMVTLTLQHTVTDCLADLAGALNAAYRAIKVGRPWQNFKASYGLVGSIAARECTHGLINGWHPHLHALYFVRGDLSGRELARLRAWLVSAWSSAVARLGWFASAAHGVDVQISTDGMLAPYLAKLGRSWSVGDELARANSKRARAAGGRTPVQLLEDAPRDELAASLFVEYANATYRKNALVWSPGLRALLGMLDERTDEEIAAEKIEDARLLVQFDRVQWRVIVSNDARADVLLVAAAGDVGLVVDYVAGFGIELRVEQIEPLPLNSIASS
jgi:hypothetical protein